MSGNKGYHIGALVKGLYHASGNTILAAQWCEKNYGCEHVVTRALNTSTAAAGGAMVPGDFAADIIELLRPATVVRSSGPIIVDMPRGTMRMGKSTSAVQGTYGSEGTRIKSEQPTYGAINAVVKKLTVMVPISNDLMRYGAASDNLVQRDIVQGLARTEDLGFIRGDGTADWPLGLRNIAPPSNRITSAASPTQGCAFLKLSAA